MTWNDISIKQGQLIHEALKLEYDLDKNIAICSAIFGKPIEYYESLPLTQLQAIIKKTTFLEQYPSPSQAAPFKYGLSIYKFKTGASQLSKQEFVMLQSYADKGIIENLHSILAILSNRYTIFPPRLKPQEFADKAEIFLNYLPFGMAYSYALFFSTYYPALLKIGQSYLQGVEKAAKEVIL